MVIITFVVAVSTAPIISFFSTLKAAADYYKEALDHISAELAQKQAKLTEVQIRRQQMKQEIAVLQDT